MLWSFAADTREKKALPFACVCVCACISLNKCSNLCLFYLISINDLFLFVWKLFWRIFALRESQGTRRRKKSGNKCTNRRKSLKFTCIYCNRNRFIATNTFFIGLTLIYLSSTALEMRKKRKRTAQSNDHLLISVQTAALPVQKSFSQKILK